MIKLKYRFNTEKKKSLLVYAILLIISLIGLMWGQHLAEQQENIRFWPLGNLLLMFIGIPFILLQKEAGLPEVLQTNISNRKRFGIPLLIGLLFGAMDVLVMKVIMHPQPYESLPPFLQPFPYSIFLFTSGAFEVEVFFRLIPLTLLLLLVGQLILKGRYYQVIFWSLAVLTSLVEPMEQWQDGTLWFIIYTAGSGFLFNLLQAVWFKKAGFLASLTIRLGHYLLWHILLGIYVEHFEIVK